MDRGRQEQSRTEDPQQRPLNRIATPGDPRDHREHEGGGGGAGLDRISRDRRDHLESALVGGPVAGVGAQAFGKRGRAGGFEQAGSANRPGGREGKVEDGADSGEGEQVGRALAADQGGKGRRRGELDQGGGGEEGAGQPAAADLPLVRPTLAALHRQDQRRHQEEADRVEVSAPRRLDDQQRGPEIPDEHGGGIAARAARDPVQEEAAAKVEAEPHELGCDDGAAREGDCTAGHRARATASSGHSAQERHRAEQQLAERRVDGRDLGVVDLPVPGGAQRGKGLVAGWVGVGVDALREEVAVPQVAVDVV